MLFISLFFSSDEKLNQKKIKMEKAKAFLEWEKRVSSEHEVNF